jgi:GNAT superfamily N-acetyltransferase
MSESFVVRLATPADADTIAWHRARTFRDMGDVPPNLFEEFRAKAQRGIEAALARDEYFGWLASPGNQPKIVIGGAGVLRQKTLPYPVSQSDQVKIAEGRYGLIVNVFTEPEWRKRGVAALLLKQIIDWSRAKRLDRLVLHASEEGRSVYERLGFVAKSNEMRLALD